MPRSRENIDSDNTEKGRKEAGTLGCPTGVRLDETPIKAGTIHPEAGRAWPVYVTDVDFGDWREQAKFAALLFEFPDPEVFKGATS
jgi:hypothetical protein